jgi:4-hydroxybenzoate polyprenyltransferase
MKPTTLIALARPFTLLAPMVGVVAGAFVAAAALQHAMPVAALACAVTTALLVTAASNAWNQVFDVDIDRINKPSRPLPSGRLTARHALLFGHVTALLGLALAWFVGPSFFACVVAGVFATWIYSAPPLRTKQRTWGALLTIAIPRGVLVPVAGWSVVAEVRLFEPWALGIVSGLYVLGAAVTKDFADVEGDVEHACHTLPATMGVRPAARLVAPFLVLPFLLYPVFGALGWLQPPTPALWILAGVLCTLGLVAALNLVRDPEALAEGAGNHPAWIAMYLLLLAMHIGTALVYTLTLGAA